MIPEDKQFIIHDPQKVLIDPEKELPEQYDQVAFWPRGAGCAVAGAYFDGNFYQARMINGNRNIQYELFGGVVDYWMRLPQCLVKDRKK